MRARTAVALLILGVLSLGLAYAALDARGTFRGCSVFIESEASAPVAWRVEGLGEAREGTVAPGGVAEADLCWIGPAQLETVNVSAEGRGWWLARVGGGCEARALVNDTALVVGAPECA
ncbi:MAG TPA: hypothetical protein VHH36_00990 [Candidatus Thermoplasmatota archaeon]|nr:hypothetical protein [Candidatus Thermoplasmatota archaeon]